MIKARIIALSGSDSFGHKTTATISPIEDDALRCDAIIPWLLRGKAGDLQVGDEVIVDRFVDGSSMIFSRADGDFKGVIYASTLLLGDDTGLDFVALADKVKKNDDKLAEAVRAISTHTHVVEGTAATADPALATYSTLVAQDVAAASVKAK